MVHQVSLTSLVRVQIILLSLGQTIIVAKYAIDHKAQFESELEGEDLSMYGGLDAFLDLRKADFEWTNINYDSGKKNNPERSRP